MNQIDTISNDPRQLTRLVLDDGTVAEISLTYRPATQNWSMDVLYGDRAFNGIGLCTHPNLLRPWRHLIKFGIACVTTDGAEPVTIDDFTNGRAALYLLNEADVAEAETVVLGAP